MPSFRDNLRTDKKYITSWMSAGWANDQIGVANLIWIAKLTNRIPILDGLSPQYHMKGNDTLWFGDFFDLDYLSEKMGFPIVEWRDVKDPSAKRVDSVGCWSSWALARKQHDGGDQPRTLKSAPVFHLDLGFTRVPRWTLLRDTDQTTNIFRLSQLGTNAGYRDAIQGNVSFKSTIKEQWMLPDQHLFCIDHLFYTSITTDYDSYDSAYAPSWKEVGQYMRWRPDVVDLAKSFLREAFNVKPGETIPEFVAMHVRRTDFKTWCGTDIPLLECLPQPKAFSRRVEEIKAEIQQQHKKVVTHVLVVSDDPEPILQYARENGKDRKMVDHATKRTTETYGGWYPAVLDAIFLSMASGIVGTQTSTYSLVSELRVQTWNDGPRRKVLWGHLHADDHH
ncbi:hypothetical protein C8R43DRAFT_71801 [Mycena crocata]|nr:hypothetical protein C8R43DRAFT_71801 [Mycena crocata]